MAFVGKSFNQLLVDLQKALEAEGAAVTDFNKGSILYTIGRALMRVVADGYLAAEDIAQDATPVTAKADVLEMDANTFGLEKNFGSYAFGTLIAKPKGSQSATIRKDDTLVIGGQAVMTVDQDTLLAPPFALVPVAMGVVGSRWNLPAGTEVVPDRDDLKDTFTFLVGNSLDTSGQPVGGFTGGQNTESDDHLRNRLALRILSLSRGTNPAVNGAAAGFPFLKSVEIMEHSPMIGMMTLYVDDGTAEPVVDLNTRRLIMENLEDVRGVGIGVVIKAVEKISDDIVIDIKVPRDNLGRPLIPLDQAKSAVGTKVSDMLLDFKQGDPLYLSRLIDLAFEAEKELLDAKVKSPKADVVPEPGQVFRAKSVTVNAS